RGRVHQHPAEVTAQPVEGGGDLRAGQQGRGVRRYGPGGQHRKVLVARGMDQGRELELLGDEVGQARLAAHAEALVGHRPAQVGIHHQRRLARGGEQLASCTRVVVLPSPGAVPVTSTTCPCSPFRAKSSAVRSVWYASVAICWLSRPKRGTVASR